MKKRCPNIRVKDVSTTRSVVILQELLRVMDG